MDYFLEYDRAMLTLSDYENESDEQAVQTKWNRTSYLIKGVSVCGDTFIHVYR